MTIDLDQLKEIVQSSNINFLVGAGLSVPYLSTLGNIEKSIEDANGDEAKILEQKQKYFNDVMLPCIDIIDDGKNLLDGKKRSLQKTCDGYSKLFETLNRILLQRKSTILSKQVNIFTTNIDIFMENALEDLNLQYNDGFTGNISPRFQTSNFKKSVHKISAHFDNISEIPTFNIIKLHGSLSWQMGTDRQEILYSHLEQVAKIETCKDDQKSFTAEYNKLQIVNPTRGKFEETVMGVMHYELLRMYSGELEKENSVLFVMGFSMADEHIREITLRAANSNPTLKIFIFCYEHGETENNCQSWFNGLKYKNVEIVVPDEGHYDIFTITSTVLDTIPHQPDKETDSKKEAFDEE